MLSRLEVAQTSRMPDPGEYDVIVQWGAFLQERSGQRLLQPVQSVLRAQDRKRTEELLALHGIACELDSGQRNDNYRYMYRVPVFHLEALTVYLKKSDVLLAPRPSVHSQKGGAFAELGPDASGYHVNRAKREAVKAIYALGLDYGIVTVGIEDAKSPVRVLQVEAVPDLDERLAELFAAAIVRYEQGLEKEAYLQGTPVKLGMDPEFVLRDASGEIVFADRFMDKDGRVGCDSLILPDLRKIFPLAELRPSPSEDVRQLVINLQKTMRLAAGKITDPHLEWLAGGMPVPGFPLGGHIHFSSVWMNVHLVRALDNYVALPLVLLEDVSTRGRRPQYGCLGDVRRKSYGGFEYRTLPSWILSPTVTKGVLALAKLVATHYLELSRQPLQNVDIQTFYYTGDKKQLRSTVTLLLKDIRETSSYPQYEKYLQPFKELLLRMEPWKEQEDFRKRWKIRTASEDRGASYQIMV
nr:hypothetical protein [Paenibacillus hamazuiensis]